MEWGWSRGRQETAEFKILEAYFCASHLLTKRITDFYHPLCPHNNTGGWRIVFVDGTEFIAYE